jgi:hypothetical protein
MIPPEFSVVAVIGGDRVFRIKRNEAAISDPTHPDYIGCVKSYALTDHTLSAEDAAIRLERIYEAHCHAQEVTEP